MKLEEVNKCGFPSWYENFKRITIKSILLPLPDGFVEYILKDGIVLPKNSKPTYSVEARDSDSSDEETWENNDMLDPEAPNFPDFDEKIKVAIDTLGRKVFPKLNWSSPKDAAWIAFNNSCCCTSVSDVYLLLKSSDFIIHDLTKMYQLCEDFVSKTTDSVTHHQNEIFHLVLREWMEIDTSGEFRCFVKDNNLIGICQREHSLYFEHINLQQDEIIADVQAFFHKNIRLKFPCQSYVFDVYRKKKNLIYLIDFNPFAEVTESLLFEWEELNNECMLVDNNGLPAFRFISDNCGVQPRTLSYHAIPRDIVDISTGADSFKLVDLMKLKIDQQKEESTDEENDVK